MISTISARLSAKIKGISFLCALMVVLLHAAIYGLEEPGHIFTWHAMRFLSYGVTRVAVPLFFFISGLLFAHQFDNGMPFPELLKRRAVSLGKPYIYWSLIYVFTLTLFTIVGNHISGRPLNDNTCLTLPLTSWKNPFRIFGFDLFIVPVCGPLWYVRNLFMLFPIFALLQKLLKDRIVGGIFLTAVVICYFLHSLKIEPEPWWQLLETGFAVRGLLCFSAGIYFKRFPFPVKVPCVAAVVLCLLWFLLAWPWKFSFNINVALNSISVLVGCAAFWSIYDFLPWREKLESRHFIHYSFFIYVSHHVIMSILFCQKVCSSIERRIPNSELLIYAARYVVPVVLGIALAKLLERYAPKVYSALTGGR